MSSYAIVESGSKQYWVEANSVIQVDRLPIEATEKKYTLDKVLFFKDGDSVKIGEPVIKGAQVICEHLGPVRGPKVINYRYRRRKASARKVGHRQDLSSLRIKEIKI